MTFPFDRKLPRSYIVAMHSLLLEHQNDISALCRTYGVVRLEVFGSAARVDDFDPIHSDIDFLLSADSAFTLKKYFDFRHALSKVLDRSVDLVFDHSVENPYIRADINRSRELVHAA